ncbi:hypothetical protein Poli38472_003604 [Pythium oligandrum]|uniref:Myb-like domain-containing protein n=1 Tax=Pythium oligandrum TaxID=41045 RepID=A0A8K1CMJ6_PYTOL|nr:hypothetical protein Poli38472_003604 [Pythium oligandrum]|eukprot:TMW65839.1 hypothetical protein Poli38472_003604 [Pythium oligandrum]
MADVVRSGAIFRVRDAASMRSPTPRLPGVQMPRGRIAAATPETPAMQRRRARSALEVVVTRGTAVSTPVRKAALGEASETGTQKKRKRLRKKKKTPASVLVPTPQRIRDDDEDDDDEDRVSSPLDVLRSFNRLVARSPVSPTSPMPSHLQKAMSNAQVTARARRTVVAEADERPMRRRSYDNQQTHSSHAGRKRTRQPEPEDEPDASADDAFSVEATDESADDGFPIRKRLVYADTPPAKTKRRDASPEPALSKPALKPKAKAKAKPAPKKKPTARAWVPVPVLSDWYVQWPPSLDLKKHVQLTVCGLVQGQPAQFQVGRRVSEFRFVTHEGVGVRLDGCINIEQAQKAGVPTNVMEAMLEGLPKQWRKQLKTLVPALARAAKKPSKAPTGQVRMLSSSSLDEQSFTLDNVEMTPHKDGEQRSRSGRRLTKVMEWWRNERLLTNADGESRIETGSPAYIPSARKKESDDEEEDDDGPTTSAAALSKAVAEARNKIQAIRDAQLKSVAWTDEQLVALEDAKAAVPTTEVNFWAEVANLVPGKTADECRTRTFESVQANTRKGGGPRRAAAAVPVDAKGDLKIFRAGSNRFKKQVREFVHDYEKKHVDDLFAESTPSKDGFVGDLGLDDLRSPGGLGPANVDADDDDSDEDDLISGRELLEKVPLSKRDEVDSYVLTLKRNHTGLGKSIARKVPTFVTPPPKQKTRVRQSVHIVEEVGAHLLEGYVSPGGTTRLRLERDSDADSMDEELDEDEDSSGDYD